MFKSIPNTIEVYAGGNGTNITATLLNSGNFVVRETNVNGSAGRILWESFDYPTDTLLPGIKLGVNHRTGRNWHLTSWFENFNPASGAFTLEWDPSTRKLIVQRRGLIYWTSGDLKDYTNQILRLTVKEFENIPKPDFVDFNYNFTNVSNGVEDYFSYSPIIDPKSTPEDRKTISGWQLKYNGDIYNRDRAMIAEVSHCYGYNIEGSSVYEGCEPSCRNHNETFVLKSGRFANGNGSEAIADFDDDYNLTESDCRGKCWNDCECLGFRLQSLRPKALSVDMTLDVYTGKGKILLLYRVLMVLPLNNSFLFQNLQTKRSYVDALDDHLIGKRKKEELHELMTLEEYTETHPVESDRGQGHHLTLFTYSSILRATGSFSLTNKLGEGGFGPVYKGKTVEGREIAVKVLSRMSVQGLLEFKIELILISKIQHVNLVKVLGFCVHGDEKMIIYDYMPNKSLDFFLFFDTLKQGDRLNSSTYLVFVNRVFTLGFYSLENTNNSYLGVWFTDNSYGQIWPGNKDISITDNSSILTKSSTRKCINNSSGGAPIELYANENGMTITATMLNSGNFLVKKININGYGIRVLWQNFDYPTDTILSVEVVPYWLWMRL
ncbi:G-type lectin S-receptor-like serine/threonine-protein kinase CES101, partial [Olea europaea var. sylvestris]|uniref:G-type lectin S-receptor-like serine/threonine-protein kinase CES101 n=1 Tax=Olea europaea var. sylvestris TaxID=158386 RepID=UPI000C1CF790